LASGTTVEAAAELAGISRATAFRRLQDPEFQRRIKQTRGEMIERAAGHLAAGATEASITLRNLLGSDSEKVRLAAAKTIIEGVLKVRDATEFEERLTTLEKLAAEQKESRQ
jgi:hypothetical protein